MRVYLRTPDRRFRDLPDFSYKPSYACELPGFEDLRLHYVDTGGGSEGLSRPGAPVALCLHGQRGWAYAFRKIIPSLTDAGFRVIAPDFFGFGRSDKPLDDRVYGFGFHRDSVLALIDHLDLQHITLVGYDWGGWIGATLPMDRRGRVEAMILANMTLHTPDQPLWPGFDIWLAMHNCDPDPDIHSVISVDCPQLSGLELQGYEAPFPDYRYKAAIRRFPNLIPRSDYDEAGVLTEKARGWLTSEWRGPAVLLAGVRDRVLGERTMRRQADLIGEQATLLKLDCGAHVFEQGEDAILPALKMLSRHSARLICGAAE